MGGNLVLQATLHRPSAAGAIKGVVLGGPALRVPPKMAPPSPVLATLGFLSRIAPK